MEPVCLICPQCGAPLPRQALWRTVTCVYCTADVTRSEDVVHASRFRDAYQRAIAAPAPTIGCGHRQYRAIAQLGAGAHAKVVLADRVGALTERVVLKIAHADVPHDHLTREKDVLDQLQAGTAPGSAYFSKRLPQAVALGSSGNAQRVLVLRHPTGFWGSLADVKRHHPQGIDARHVVWMWRRVLEVLAYAHADHWAHGNLAPEHLLVHPNDHGILIIGWARARRCRPSAADRGAWLARDLMQLAWSMRVMLSNARDEPAIPCSTPRPLAALLTQASTDAAWCIAQGAEGLNELLGRAARASFGSPRFVHFSPTPSL